MRLHSKARFPSVLSGPLSLSLIHIFHLPAPHGFSTVFHDFCIQDKYAAAREPESDVAAPAAPAGPPIPLPRKRRPDNNSIQAAAWPVY